MRIKILKKQVLQHTDYIFFYFVILNFFLTRSICFVQQVGAVNFYLKISDIFSDFITKYQILIGSR